ncbi:unnamed protein product [Closterium sp. NIES-64]|nr:unnamed protein product [Closterium sp. NIES-64]
MRFTMLARLCTLALPLLSVGLGGTDDCDPAIPARMPALLTARAQPLAGPRCVNRFPQKPLCKFVDDLAASPLTFLDAPAGETIKLGAYDVYQASAIAVSWLSRVVVPPSQAEVPSRPARHQGACVRRLPQLTPFPPLSILPSPQAIPPPPTPPAQCEQKFHRDLPNTKVYAYGASAARLVPGPVLVATRGTTTKVSAASRAPAR